MRARGKRCPKGREDGSLVSNALETFYEVYPPIYNYRLITHHVLGAVPGARGTQCTKDIKPQPAKSGLKSPLHLASLTPVGFAIYHLSFLTVKVPSGLHQGRVFYLCSSLSYPMHLDEFLAYSQCSKK